MSIYSEDPITTYNFKVIQGRQTCIQINYDDYKTLEGNAYLNDKIIMFYLKFLQSELSAEELRGKFIVMDSYFFPKLPLNEDGQMGSPLVNYNSVKKWTKSLSFFDNDFVLVPINSEEHWSLLIICYPGKMTNIFNDINNGNPDYPYIIYLDSFYDNNPYCISIFKKYLFYEFAVKNNLFTSDKDIVNFIQDKAALINEYSPLVIYNIFMLF
jgi:sentrin-specific protease 7